jgi:SulP family sulfate permease
MEQSAVSVSLPDVPPPASQGQGAALAGRLREYGWHGLRADLVAGLTVASVAVPQAMAYALIAGVEPRYGLYTAIVLTAVAASFGSSAHLVSGPVNAISLVVFGAIGSLQLNDPARSLEAVFVLAVMVGVVQVLIFAFKIGDLTRFVSESVILGFMLGAGTLVALSQTPNLLGAERAGSPTDHLLVRLGSTLLNGPVRPHAVALGLGTLLTAVGLRALGRRLRVPLPDLLAAVVLASLAGWLTGWQEDSPAFPPGLPTFHLPRVEWPWVRALSGSALAVAVLGLLESLAVAKSISARTRQPLDCNRQCLSEGLANLAGGFFQCMPGAGSLTRSSINYQAGAVSRLAALFSAAAVALTVVLFAGLARFVPRPALAGVLFVTAWRLIDWTRLRYCLKATRFDRTIALATAAAAVFISVEFSVLIGVFLSFLFFVPRASRLLASELTVSTDRVLRERKPDDPRCGKLVILGLEGELFFGAAPELDQHLAGLSARAAAGARVIVLRLKRVRNPDMVCLERLQHFLQQMQGRGVPVLLSGVRADFADALARLGFHTWLPPDHLFLEGALAADTVGPFTEPATREVLSSTLRAVKRAYELLGDDLCPTCPRRQPELDKSWYYMI